VTDPWMAEREVTRRQDRTQHRAHVKGQKYGKFPGQAVIDAAAERQMNGGYRGKQRSRTNQCGVCFQLRSIEGTCGCSTE
jgi:hypothetical protein